MIWGMTLEPGKLYTEVMGDEVHLSMATLESRKDFVPATDEKPDSICHIIMKTEKSEYLLCTLVNGNIYQQNLDLKLMPREKVTFSVQGSNVVYLTGYSTSYPDIDDQFEDELSETGDWEPDDLGETSLDNTEEAIALSDEVFQVKGEAEDGMEDVIEDMADEHVQQQQPVTVVQLDNPEDLEQEQLPQEETEETKPTEDAEQQEMIFSIAELEANVKEEPDDSVTIVPSEAEERQQGHDQTQQAEEEQSLQQQQMQQQTQQQLHHQQLSQQQMHQQNQQQMHQQQSQLQQHLQPQVQFLPNVQSTVQTPIQRPSTSHQRAPVHINQRGPRFAQRPRVGRGRPPLASRAVQRQKMRYMSPSNTQQTFQQSQSSASYPQMQNVQGSPARMPIAYQGTTVRSSQPVVNNPQVQGQVMLNQPGTSQQGGPGSSSGNSSLSSQGMLSRSTQPGKAMCNICGKVCKETSLRRHQATHGDMRPYQCTFCGRRFQRSDNCRSHERSHTHRGFYKCQFCGKGYSRSNLRNAHERNCRASV